MTSFRAAALSAVLLALPGFAGCAARRAGGEPFPAKATFGVYRGSLDTAGGSERFRLLLYAAFPDTLHAEVLGAIGGPTWVLDGGGGRLSVTDLRQGVAYVGEASADSLDRVLGIRVSPDEFVAALLTGARASWASEMLREPSDEGLPARFEVCQEGRCLRLERRRTRHATPAVGLGTGEPPQGVVVMPLDRLPAFERPAILRTEPGSPGRTRPRRPG